MSLVRQASAAHAAALEAIHAASFPPGEQWSAEAIAALLGLPGVFGLLHPNGGLLLARVAADEAEILTLAVVPAQRGRGHGGALLRAAHKEAVTRGARRVLLEVATANAAANALYRSAGYREVGRRQAYYADGSDALVLACELSCAAAAGG